MSSPEAPEPASQADSNVQDLFDDDEDDGVAQNSRRRTQVNGAIDQDQDEDMDDDLFGDVEDAPAKERDLDDEVLDSGDDLDRNDRQGADVEMDDAEDHAFTILEHEMYRQSLPRPSDGELYLLKIPSYAPIEPTAFDEDTFEPPLTEDEIHSDPNSARSAFQKAASTVRWRKSPVNPDERLSNARILRWSDGSLTVQYATQPKKQYTVSANSLAPPSTDPIKPTPNALKPGKKAGYHVSADSFTYLMTPAGGYLHTLGKCTVGLRIDASDETADAAKLKLQQAIVAARRGSNGDTGEVTTITVTEDPEAARRKAEQLDKEKTRAERKRQAMQQRQDERQSGLGGRRGGLTAGGLEDDDELGKGYVGGATARAAKRAKPKKSNRRGEILSDDEDDELGGGRYQNDEYEEDDFVAGSDEEEEVAVESDEDVDEGINLGGRSGRQASPAKRKQQASPEEEDAEGDPDEEVGTAGEASPQSRVKRRRVIDDDDDQEDE